VERVYLGVGSNLGDRKRHLEAAKDRIQKVPQTRFLRSSSVLETEPVGGPPQGKYLNAVWEIETTLTARRLKEELQRIESELGRKRSEPNAPREIDLDILFYGDRVIEEEKLTIPHARLHERAFVLAPLMELAPEKVHPKLKKSVRKLFEEQELQ